MTYLAASSLLDRIRPGDAVLVITGAGTPPFMPKGETDGPPGAGVLARAMIIALGTRPVVIAEPHCLEPVVAAIEAAGVVCGDEQRSQTLGNSALALQFPYGPNTRGWVSETVEKYRPRAMIFVEKCGSNEQVYSTSWSARQKATMLPLTPTTLLTKPCRGVFLPSASEMAGMR